MKSCFFVLVCNRSKIVTIIMNDNVIVLFDILQG